jgi:hypothetical protein
LGIKCKQTRKIRGICAGLEIVVGIFGFVGYGSMSLDAF